jgi:predicted flap endonuclease-1-like 5' DNA nuclease
MLGCAVLGTLAGILTCVMLLIFSEFSATGAVFMGIVAAGVLTVLMVVLFCRELPPIGSAVNQPAVTPAPAPAPAAKPTPAPKPAPAKAAEETAPAAEPAEADKPQGLTAARDGQADNLKEIKGVGPKLEKLLNSMGYYHFDQIAAWTDKEVAWVDENLQGFKGRVSRDNWVDQAKILASGGETEFSKRVDEGDVY